MKYFATILTLTILITSCTKEKIKSELILGDWQINALTVDPPQVVNNIIITNLYAQMEDCDKDNTLSFFDNKTYKADEGATNCDSLDPQNISGNWMFLNNETELRLIYQSDTIVYNVIDLDEELLKMNYSQRDSNNIMHTLSVTFEHL
jgi:hypothetical protein